MKLDIVFIAQRGELEIMAALLAASIRKNCSEEIFLHVIEPVPESVYGRVSSRVRQFLDGLDVQWHSFPNPISDNYKIFNKLNAFRIPAHSDHVLFLDSDMLVRRSLKPLEAFFNYPLAAKVANKQRFSAQEEDWKAIYDKFNVPLPEERFPAWDSGEWAPPYLNAGAILCQAGLDFSRHWIEATRIIHFDETLPIPNRNTVQISLPVTLYWKKIRYALLDNRFNFCLSKGWLQKRMPWSDEEAIIIHYFRPKGLLEEQKIASELHRLISDYRMESLLEESPSWQKILKKLTRGKLGVKGSAFLPVNRIKDGQALSKIIKESQTAPMQVAVLPGMEQYSSANHFSDSVQQPEKKVVFAENKDPTASEQPFVFSPHQNYDNAEVRAWKKIAHWFSSLQGIARSRGEHNLVMVLNPFLAISLWKEGGIWSLLSNPRQIRTNLESYPLVHPVDLSISQRIQDLANLKWVLQRAAGLWNILVEPLFYLRPRLWIVPMDKLAPENLPSLLPQEAGINLAQGIAQMSKVISKNALQAEEIEIVRGVCSAHAAKLGYFLYQMEKEKIPC